MLRDLDDYAVQARLMTSPLQLGDWQSKTFGEEIIERRRARERAIAAMQKGALVTIEPLDAPESLPVASPGAVTAGPIQALPVARRPRPSFVATAAAVAVVVIVLAGAVMAIAMR